MAIAPAAAREVLAPITPLYRRAAPRAVAADGGRQLAGTTNGFSDPQTSDSRDEVSVFLYLMAAADNGEERSMKVRKVARTLTLPQIGYWLTAGLLMVGGLAAVIASLWIPWEGPHLVVSEIGAAIFTAGILAALVEPFFRKEFARDAFLAAFRYVLPPEFRDEIEKILKLDFICEKQSWTVKVEKIDEETVLVTTSFERTLRNKTSSNKSYCGWYTVPELYYRNGQSKILDCMIQNDSQTKVFKKEEDKGHYLEAKTEELVILPKHTVKVCGRATQYRRINDCIFETFKTPAVSPEIEVMISDDFGHDIDFGTGTKKDIEKSIYSNKYTLSGVYFPGQYMQVHWWPKKATE